MSARDHYLEPQESYVTVLYSGKISSDGIWPRVIKESMENLENIKIINDANLEDTKFDFLFGGSLKTLLPTKVTMGIHSWV
ncbi:MAG: hypothetical protein E3J52_11715 [Promethearchaeota archaeon]|nr:MAG: hypothetical protein E3J52_11715 [Candidatus Lokiarchaeota archaeon]